VLSHAIELHDLLSTDCRQQAVHFVLIASV